MWLQRLNELNSKLSLGYPKKNYGYFKADLNSETRLILFFSAPFNRVDGFGLFPNTKI